MNAPRSPSLADLARALGLPAATTLLPSLDVLLATATALVLARYGAIARLSTLDGVTWQCVCVDPETGVALTDHPMGTSASPWGAASRLLDVLHELNVREALGEADDVDVPGVVRCEPAADVPCAEVG